MTPAQEGKGKLHPEFQAVISSFAPHLKGSSASSPEVCACGHDDGAHGLPDDPNDPHGIYNCMACRCPGFVKRVFGVSKTKAPQESKVDFSLVAPFKINPYRQTPAEAQLQQYEKGVNAGWSACAEFARKQWERRLEEFRRTLGEANASHELLFRMLNEKSPL